MAALTLTLINKINIFLCIIIFMYYSSKLYLISIYLFDSFCHLLQFRLLAGTFFKVECRVH